MPQFFVTLPLSKVAHLDDLFSEYFKLKGSPVEGQSLWQEQKKRRKRKGEKREENRKSKSLKTYVTFSSKNNLKILISAHTQARAKMLKNAMIVESDPYVARKSPKCPKTHFGKKLQESMG